MLIARGIFVALTYLELLLAPLLLPGPAERRALGTVPSLKAFQPKLLLADLDRPGQRQRPLARPAVPLAGRRAAAVGAVATLPNSDQHKPKSIQDRNGHPQ